MDAFHEYTESKHHIKPQLPTEYTSLVPLFQTEEDNQGLSGWTIVSDPLHGHVALYRSLNGTISNVIMTAELKLHELRKKQEKITKGFNNQRELASKEFKKEDIKNRLNMSFQEACEGSLLKARDGLKGWKKMEIKDGEDDDISIIITNHYNKYV